MRGKPEVSISTETPAESALHIAFVPAQAVVPAAAPDRVCIELPSLAGDGAEEIFEGLASVGVTEGVALLRCDGLVVGHAREAVSGDDMEAAARRLYARVLAACSGRQLYRMWNYVPRINEEVAGLENYRAFCKGRSLAFEAAFGAGFERQLPAASAVGSDGRTIEVVFAAGQAGPRHVENPEQVPAYLYPAEHGPRPPSFSRATVVEEGGRRWVFVSGTAAIKGHATVGAGSLDTQITCTLDNLRLILRASGVGGALGADAGGARWTRHFKVYLRRETDLAEARRRLEGTLIFPGDRVCWLRSDICRAELDIEIEATLRA
jgi:enamine deaminase RidA (YjgF/YER057c/UK114 family)